MDNGKTPVAIGVAALALILVSPPAFASPAPQTQSQASGARPTLDPIAIEALRTMGAYLKSLKSFELHSKATLETIVADTDLKIDLGYEGTYRVERPSGFYVELRSDRQIREYYYDGKTFSVNVPRQGFFATVSAPPTMRAAVDQIYTDYGISLPLADLFYWADDPTVDGITSAIRIGYAKLGTIETDQFVYRGDDLDWQVWIARGKQPLPIRIVITTRSEPTHPSYAADLVWNTAPSFTAAAFTFKPPSKSAAIAMAQVSPQEK